MKLFLSLFFHQHLVQMYFFNTSILMVPCGSLEYYNSNLVGWSQYFVTIDEMCNVILTVTSSNDTMGTVLGSGEYEYGTNAILTAIPNEGFHFLNWNDGNTDNPRSIVLKNDTTFVATFALDSYTITVISANDSMGTVSGGGEYEVGAEVTITATPNEGYLFANWNDGNTDNPRIITLTRDTTFIANFALDSYTITVISANDSMGTVSGGGEYEVGTEVTITATPNEGYRFVSWNDGNIDNPRTITVIVDTTYVATFEEGVGIESRDILSELTFYPNPTRGIITLSRNDIQKVEVMDATGKVVMIVDNKNVIDLSKLTKGYYTLRITTAEGVAIRKVIRN